MSDKHHGEIIIIKRHGGHEEEHHGGAWKIAFADFMTAMMAFFLVLWIINATDKNTKTIIARYFNPLKLEDMSKANKGIRQLSGEAEKEPPKADTEGATSTPSEKKKTPLKTGDDPNKKDPPAQDKEEKEKAGADAAHPKAHISEAALVADPYASLDQIAGKVAVPGMPQGASKSASSAGGDAGAEAPAVDPDAFVDPFKPVERGASGDAFAPANNAMPAPQSSTTPAANGVQPPPPAPVTQPNPVPQATAAAAEQAQHPAPDGKAIAAVAPAASPPDATHAGAAPMPAPPPPAPAAGAAPAPSTAPAAPQPGAATASASPPPGAAAEAAKLQSELAKVLRAELHAQAAPGVDVQATPEGILISLTDDYNFSMFAIGSSEPQPKVVRIMDKIGQALKSRPGLIVVRGHTDGRQYRSGVYDNWRLSEARAQMAYYMLVRGGLEEKRVERIEGYADRHLKKPADPEAAENRRIEILLRKDK
jgi:chemotaxis protein MotB